jgi:hypothetical protein
MKKLAHRWEMEEAPVKGCTMGPYESERNVVQMMCHEPLVDWIEKEIDGPFQIKINGKAYKVFTRYYINNPKYGEDPIWVIFKGRKLFINKSCSVRYASVQTLARNINRIITKIIREQ